MGVWLCCSCRRLMSLSELLLALLGRFQKCSGVAAKRVGRSSGVMGTSVVSRGGGDVFGSSSEAVKGTGGLVGTGGEFGVEWVVTPILYVKSRVIWRYVNQKRFLASFGCDFVEK